MKGNNEHKFSFRWSSPSNIALVKYWGKRAGQWPMNPSVSFSLEVCRTSTQIDFIPLVNSQNKGVEFRFQGFPKPEFEARINAFLASVQPDYPCLSDFHLRINSNNTFPHAAGIASSASAMSALALCVVNLKAQLIGRPAGDRFYQHASELARLGSGSAARSLYPGFTLWGKIPELSSSSNRYAIPINAQVHPKFQSLHDAILVTGAAPKAVSSSQGHALMKGHRFAANRYKQARAHTKKLLLAMQQGDEETFVDVVEQEALSLHAMMMTANPPFVLMLPQTLALIAEIKRFREQTNIRVCFTLDAGPNIHMLYFERDRAMVLPWIEQQLLPFCEQRQWIDDHLGQGPIQKTGVDYDNE